MFAGWGQLQYSGSHPDISFVLLNHNFSVGCEVCIVQALFCVHATVINEAPDVYDTLFFPGSGGKFLMVNVSNAWQVILNSSYRCNSGNSMTQLDNVCPSDAIQCCIFNDVYLKCSEL